MYNIIQLCSFCLNTETNLIKIDDKNNKSLLENVKYALPEYIFPNQEGLLHICSMCQNAIQEFCKLKHKFMENNKVITKYFDILKDKNESQNNMDLFRIKTINIRDYACNVINKNNINKNSLFNQNVDQKNDPDVIIIDDESDSDNINNEMNESTNTNEKYFKNVSNIYDSTDFESTTRKNKNISVDLKKEFINSTSITCKKCSKSFTNIGNLNRHMKAHIGVKDYECFDCGKKFSRKINLISHSETHGNNKKFKCKVCSKTFKHSDNLKIHLKVHLKFQSFECTVCHKKLSTKSSLNTHMSNHTGNKDYACKLCNLKFLYKSGLVAHMKNHSRIKEFECFLCNKRFIQKYNLNLHMKIHTKNTEYKCSICKIKFDLRRDLKNHLKIHVSDV